VWRAAPSRSVGLTRFLWRPDVGIRTPARTQEVRAPRLSSLWLGLVTPLRVRVGRKLIASIRHPTAVRDRSALTEFRVRPVGYREAIAAALRTDDQVEDWADPSAASGSRFVHSLGINVNASPEQAFAPIRRIGGSTGRHYANWLWRLRGVVDIWMGRPGLRRGRRRPDRLEVGDAVDCWRVEAHETNHRLRLAARMKLPGRAWLEFRVDRDGSNSVIRQTAVFDPRGRLRRAYWFPGRSTASCSRGCSSRSDGLRGVALKWSYRRYEIKGRSRDKPGAQAL
jgi:hypothetical protein